MIYKLIIGLLILLFGNYNLQNTNAKDDFTQDLKKRTFNYFWDQVDQTTYQTADRYPQKSFTSIAATGFGLTSYIIGSKNGYISRKEGAQRVYNTLNWLLNSKQSINPHNSSGYMGFYYHFLQYENGLRYKNVELSTIDTGLLMAGILSCQSYFNNENAIENKIRILADSLYLRVNWNWAMNGEKNMSMGWKPESGFLKEKWKGYNEAMILLILAIGSPTYSIPASSWESWCDNYTWSNFKGYEFVNFGPLFGHQYSQMYVDFRNIQDTYMSEKKIDYFENSRRATLSNRQYCIDNPIDFNAYSENCWGLTACDGPANSKLRYKGNIIQFSTYKARGASALHIIDDGTIAPTAAGGSVPFSPEICLSSLIFMKEMYNGLLYDKYGFRDAFNASYPIATNNGKDFVWIDTNYVGIDQGPILIQLENYESELIWNLMKKNKYIISGLKKAGFKGGWLDE